jgi:hypothetical protein
LLPHHTKRFEHRWRNERPSAGRLFSSRILSEEFLWLSKQSSGSASQLCKQLRKNIFREIPQPAVPAWGDNQNIVEHVGKINQKSALTCRNRSDHRNVVAKWRRWIGVNYRAGGQSHAIPLCHRKSFSTGEKADFFTIMVVSLWRDNRSASKKGNEIQTAFPLDEICKIILFLTDSGIWKLRFV